jgi:uroporphyrin-III C-methyltransferase / precorrin-2 dehydrogenase / sirohydrochlorin ferrochelatase
VTVHNKPAEIEPARMAALSRLPLFYSLTGKRAVVAGNTAAAAWKAELLSAAGAQVEVFAALPAEEMLALAATAPPPGAIALHRRIYASSDLAGAAIAVADCKDEGDAATFAAAARAAGVPVNVIDRPAFSDFAFGAIVNRSPLVIGISTDGASPVFGQALRAKIEGLLPRGFAQWAAAAAAWRPRLKALDLPFRGRRAFWERFTAQAMAAPDGVPDDAAFESLLAPGEVAGAVVIVGAGPGDPELLTLRAVRALQSADVILFDAAVGAGVLDFARREAKKMLLDPTGGEARRHDDEIRLSIALARAGRRVVRLKGGDPARSAETEAEMAACRSAGVAVELVPGVDPAGERAESGGTAPKALVLASNTP